MKNPQEVFSRAVVIGAGSIGRTHLELLLEKMVVVEAVEPNIEVQNSIRVNTKLESVKLHTDLDSLDRNLQNCLAVISNWGPDHLNSVKELNSRGVSHFLIEKPLTSTLRGLDFLQDYALTRRLRFVNNFPMSYGPFFQQIRTALTSSDIGNLLGIVVNGGAKCLVTNGIHYLSLAIKLFDSIPISVSSTITNSEINPRGKQFLFLGGSSTWNFANNRQLVITFNNDSNVQLSVSILCKYGKIVIEGDEARVLRIPALDKEKIDKPARTMYASEEISIFNPNEDSESKNGLHRIYEEMFSRNSKIWEDFSHGISTTKALIAMLISNEESRLIKLPINWWLQKKYRAREWNIS